MWRGLRCSCPKVSRRRSTQRMQECPVDPVFRRRAKAHSELLLARKWSRAQESRSAGHRGGSIWGERLGGYGRSAQDSKGIDLSFNGSRSEEHTSELQS